MADERLQISARYPPGEERNLAEKLIEQGYTKTEIVTAGVRALAAREGIV
ncbi:MAG: hypothetical protein WC138_13675 [Methanoculleus sp.]